MNPFGKPSCDPKITAFLERRPDSSLDQIVAYLEIKSGTVSHAILRMRRAGQVYVSSWQIGERQWKAHFSAGPGVDAVRVPQTKEERQAKYRATAKAHRKVQRPTAKSSPAITSGPWAGLVA